MPWEMFALQWPPTDQVVVAKKHDVLHIRGTHDASLWMGGGGGVPHNICTQAFPREFDFLRGA